MKVTTRIKTSPEMMKLNCPNRNLLTICRSKMRWEVSVRFINRKRFQRITEIKELRIPLIHVTICRCRIVDT